MPKRDEAIARIASKVALASDYDEIVGELEYLWNEAIQQTVGTALQEIIDKSVKSLLSDADFADKFLKVKTENVRQAVHDWLDEHYIEGE